MADCNALWLKCAVEEFSDANATHALCAGAPAVWAPAMEVSHTAALTITICLSMPFMDFLLLFGLFGWQQTFNVCCCSPFS
jgi:hypothetical protein